MQTHNRRTGFLFLVLAGLALLAAGCAAETGAQAPPPPKVTIKPPESQELSDYEEYNGWLDADQTVEVRSRVRGHIQKAPFADGQFVKAGDVLFQLDPRPFQSELDRAKEQTKIFEAQQVAAVKEEARQRELLGKGGASQSQVDKAEADAKSLGASIASSREEVKRRELELSYASVKAEIDGKVGRAMIQEGNLVNAGGSDPLLTTIVSVDPARVFFNIDERTLTKFAKNMGKEGRNLSELLATLKDTKSPFSFALDGETEFGHSGVLRFGDNRIDPSTGTMQIYGTVENKDGKFIPGARVRVRLPVGKPYTALLVPETAILADQDKRYVLVAEAEAEAEKGEKKEKNVVRRKNVKLGRLTDDGFRAIEPEGKVDPKDPPEKWNVLIDNLQRARLNYPIDPQQPEVKTPAAKEPEKKETEKKAAEKEAAPAKKIEPAPEAEKKAPVKVIPPAAEKKEPEKKAQAEEKKAPTEEKKAPTDEKQAPAKEALPEKKL